jgi:branched-chain amino acid transport system substrate-binding protein
MVDRSNRLSNRGRSHRNRAVGLCALACAIGLLVTGCGGSKSSSATGSKTLTIGISLSLTGDFADPGKAAQRGYQLWADHINAKGGLLGRKVQLKIVDDLSSPNQVVTNYTNLITRDHADLVFGPFSSLLTAPAGQIAKRFGYSFLEPAGGGPTVFAEHLSNLFFVQPAPVVASGNVFADYILSLPAAQRPATAAYPSLDDPFSSPIADSIRARFEAAGIRTVYKGVYPAEAPDLTPVMSKVAAAKPDVIVSGTQSNDAYQQVKALVQLKYSPKFMFMANGSNSPLEFPDKVGVNNTTGIFGAGDWFPGSPESGSAEFTTEYTSKYGGTAQQIDNTSAEAYACGQLLELVAAKTGKVDNATIISTLHSGNWPTLLGSLSWNSDGAPTGSFHLEQWIDHKLVPVFPAAIAKHAPLTPKPAWNG